MLGLSNIILEMTARGADLAATMDRLCMEIEELAPGLTCTVLTVDSGGLLHPLSAPSLPQSYCDALDGISIGEGVGSCGSAAWLREPVIVTDIAIDPRWLDFRDGALALGLRACWSTPVFGESGKVIGTFALYLRECRGPTADERAIVETSVHLCSIAIDRHQRVMDRERRANVDLLTGSGNRAAFTKALASLDCSEPGSWALCIVDLDNLKVVNDGFGHQAGDLLIEAAASRVTAAASPNRIFRIGGDEFAIIVESESALRDLDTFAQAILDALGQPLSCDGHSIAPKATIGGAVLSPGDRDTESVRRNADFALYHAKESGRGGFVRYWPGIDTRIIHRIAAIKDVGAALRESRIEAHYQPIVCLDSRRIVALEALCRLQMSNGGMLAAAAFQEATSDFQIASALTERMLEIVAKDVRDWTAAGVPIEHVGINVSLGDFHGGCLAHQIAVASKLHGLPLELLVIEIAEPAYLAIRNEALLASLQALRKEGLRIALDDFGLGGGQLAPLLTLPVDMIKMDRSLIEKLAPGSVSSGVIGGLLHTAQALGITVIAEGVEREDQACQLEAMGCTYGQGFLYSRPLRKAAATSLMQSKAANARKSA